MSDSWYVLRSKPRKESSLFNYARLNGHEIFYPCIPVKPVNPRAATIRPYFPGYMFLQTDLAQSMESEFRWMPFSYGLVRFGGEPSPVNDYLVQSIRSRVAEIWEAGGMVFDGLKKGDRVIVEEGAFEGYQGIFDARLPGRERVRILLQMISDRHVPVEIHPGMISKLHPSRH